MSYSLIDLFAGCGGMSWGFQKAGFESVFAVEWDADAVETYRRNFGDHVLEGAIEDVESFPVADVIIGGPPCQGFSPLNMASVGLERRGLWRHYLRAIEQAAPSVFVMENVPELLRSGGVSGATSCGPEPRLCPGGSHPERGRLRRAADAQAGHRDRLAHREPNVARPDPLPTRRTRVRRQAVDELFGTRWWASH